MRAATQRVQRRPPTARQRYDFCMRTAGPAGDSWQAGILRLRRSAVGLCVMIRVYNTLGRDHGPPDRAKMGDVSKVSPGPSPHLIPPRRTTLV
ncbi:hypothetical protein J6590_073006 [Homalodisca vitripennis]|nr:hypothetical protein J6590_073006 [Homalodisca vitripennis]